VISERATRVRRIDHVGILVRSIDASLPFYRETLALELVADETRPDGTVRLAYLEAGDTTVQLVEPLTDGPAARYLAAKGEGLHHICFDVDDIRAALDRIPGQEGPAIVDGGRGCRVAFLAEPTTPVLVEFSQRPQ
jgi:methylmalonyl-CoA epimerase